ncbi:hypothetical protein [Acetobacter thailandicus]|uniref:hypothetical protein n=1 Tax=Acetobacter thailandicus TaxID=1502842 RepID=UPI001BA75822|nr:hypothetical protein [Acetobacter thailandicus]MBS1003503.1 hypothetical protein [Acetobacter thailandicus]
MTPEQKRHHDKAKERTRQAVILAEKLEATAVANTTTINTLKSNIKKLKENAKEYKERPDNPAPIREHIRATVQSIEESAKRNCEYIQQYNTRMEEDKKVREHYTSATVEIIVQKDAHRKMIDAWKNNTPVDPWGYDTTKYTPDSWGAYIRGAINLIAAVKVGRHKK